MSNGANTWFFITGYCLMKYLKKTMYYFLFIIKFPFESNDALYKKAIYYPSLGV